MDDYREAIWGIDPRDRQWFQLLTLVGGLAGSSILTGLELVHGSVASTPNEASRDIALGIGASFIASGFIAWGILQSKELGMSIADWLKAINERNRAKLRQEGRQVGLQEGLQEGLQQGYEIGYEDSQEGRAKQPPATNNREDQQC